MPNLRTVVTFGLVAGLFLAGCGPRYSAKTASVSDAEFRAESPAGLAAFDHARGGDSAAMGEPLRDRTDAPGTGGLANLAASQPDVYLIKNATVTVECDDARTAANSLVGSLQSAGAYVSNLNEYVDSLGRRTVTMQVRVPADKFDQSITNLESLGKTLNKQVSTEDVTEEYVDTDSRVRNLKKTEERLIDHLNRAAQLEDILRVENELTRVREQIERMEGRLRFLTNRVSFSTITVTLQEKAQAEPIIPPQSFSTAKQFSEAARSLIGFLQVIWSLAIWLLVWSPVYLAIAAAVVYLVKRARRAQKKLDL